MAAAAYVTRPRFDDPLISFLLEEAPDRIQATNADRTLMSAFWQAAASTGYFWEIGAILNAVASLGTAAAAYGLWNRLFPKHGRFGIAAPFLALAPILFELQATLTPIYQLQLSVVYLSALAIWPTHDRLPSVGRMTVAAGLICLAGSVSEYTICGALPLAFLIVARSWFEPPVVRNRALLAVCFILFGTAAGYGLLRFLGDEQFRPRVLPEYGLDYVMHRGWTIPFKLADALMSVFGGAFCREIADFSVYSKSGAMSFLAAAGLTALVARDLLRGRTTESSDAVESSLAPTVHVIWQLAVATALSLLPLLFMNLRPHDEGAPSRIFVGVQPISGCTVPALALLLCRRRLYSAVGVALVFFSVFVGFCETGRWHKSQRALDEAGRVVRPWLAEGFTLILIDFSNTAYQAFNLGNYDVEMTALLTSSWSRQERARVWVLPVGYLDLLGDSPASTTRHVRSPTTSDRRWHIDLHMRGVRRTADVDRVLLVGFSTNATARVTDITAGRILYDGPVQ